MKAILALEDGTWFAGESFTGDGETGGEVIFNTGHTGYQEILTDPSYAGQMICMTYPLIGNYGTNPEDVESRKLHLDGFIVKECCKKPSNWRSTIPLPAYLRTHGVLGVEGIDTRALTRHLRIKGAMRGMISTRELDPVKLAEKAGSLPSMEGQSLGDKVSTESPYVWRDNTPIPVSLGDGFHWLDGRRTVAVYDFGVKWNILRLLEAQGFDVLVLPWSTSADTVRSLAPDSIFVSNGPGDPAAIPSTVDTLKELCESFPVAGICLGHQLLGLAMGGKTYKLKFGHHGINHPVLDKETGIIEISSQNHGFCVDIEGLDHLKPTHINLNDNTLEGFAHKTKPVIAIQYHPEAAPGPNDSAPFFTRFRKMVDEFVAAQPTAFRRHAMTKELNQARKLFSTVGSSLKQGKVVAAAREIRKGIILAFKNPLMKAEKNEFQRLIEQALERLVADPTFKQHYPLVITYQPGKERTLLDTLKEVIDMLDKAVTNVAELGEEARKKRRAEGLAKGQAHIDAEEYAEARETFDILVKEFQHDADLVADIADRFIQAGRYKDAFDYLEAALAEDPNAMHLYNRIGIALRKMSDFATAEKYYLKALDITQSDEYLWFNIGRLYIDWQRWDKCEEAADRAIKINPKFAQAAKMKVFARKKAGLA